MQEEDLDFPLFVFFKCQPLSLFCYALDILGLVSTPISAPNKPLFSWREKGSCVAAPDWEGAPRFLQRLAVCPPPFLPLLYLVL